MSATGSPNPYPGLRPFEYEDRDHFFGRGEQVETLYAKLKQTRFVAVVGASGSGKSSVVRAGLLPRLETEGEWRWIVMRPQSRPIHELTLAINGAKADDTGKKMETHAGSKLDGDEGHGDGIEKIRQMRTNALLRSSSSGLALAARELRLPPGCKLLVIVDQFEELFRFHDEAAGHRDEAAAFVKLLLGATAADFVPVHVMLTMRLDFLGDCTRYSQLPEAINDGQFLVPRLSRPQRRQAIEEPAKRAGRPMATGLVQQIVNEVGDDPDHLPVMQHALMRTWEEAGSEKTIDLQAFEDTGGMAHALSNHANAVFAELGSGDGDAERNGGPNRFQLAAMRLFKATTDQDMGGRPIRKTETLSTIAAMAGVSHEEMGAVVELFRMPGTNFLMPPLGTPLEPGTVIDISHEALIRKWDKLSGSEGGDGWLAEEQHDRRTYRRLLDGAQRHAADQTSYLSAAQTAEGLAWWNPKLHGEAWAAHYREPADDSWAAPFGGPFSAVKKTLDDSDRHYKELQRKERFARNAKVWISLMLIALFIIGGIGYYAWQERTKAIEARHAAETMADVIQGKYESLESQQEEVRNERAALQDQLAALKAQEEQSRAAAAQLQAKSKARMATLEQTIETLEAKFATATGDAAAVRAERLALQERLASLREELAKDTSAELQAKVDSLESIILTLRAELQQAQGTAAAATPSDSERKSGETFEDCTDCPVMVVIPAGTFLMGSETGQEWDSDERPQHKVTIARPFALGKFEVTFDEYDSFALATKRELPGDQDWGRGNRPVINVSWKDAQAYVTWLSEKTGEAYRLPSEAEWEYAARAGTPTSFSFGQEITPQQANYGKNVEKTTPVDSYLPNDFGLHDMHGNVYEWVEDCWNKNYMGAPKDGSAWEKGECDTRVLRGGSLFSGSKEIRSAHRNKKFAVSDRKSYGFRVARVLDR